MIINKVIVSYSNNNTLLILMLPTLVSHPIVLSSVQYQVTELILENIHKNQKILLESKIQTLKAINDIRNNSTVQLSYIPKQIAEMSLDIFFGMYDGNLEKIVKDIHKRRQRYSFGLESKQQGEQKQEERKEDEHQNIFKKGLQITVGEKQSKNQGEIQRQNINTVKSRQKPQGYNQTGHKFVRLCCQIGTCKPLINHIEATRHQIKTRQKHHSRSRSQQKQKQNNQYLHQSQYKNYQKKKHIAGGKINLTNSPNVQKDIPVSSIIRDNKQTSNQQLIEKNNSDPISTLSLNQSKQNIKPDLQSLSQSANPINCQGLDIIDLEISQLFSQNLRIFDNPFFKNNQVKNNKKFNQCLKIIQQSKQIISKYKRPSECKRIFQNKGQQGRQKVLQQQRLKVFKEQYQYVYDKGQQKISEKNTKHFVEKWAKCLSQSYIEDTPNDEQYLDFANSNDGRYSYY